MLSEPFTSPLMVDGFFFTEFDLLTIGKFGSLSTTFLEPGGPTEDFLDLTVDLSDSVEDSLPLRRTDGEGDLSTDFLATGTGPLLSLPPGEGLRDFKSIWLPM